jgi:hypothetical protein
MDLADGIMVHGLCQEHKRFCQPQIQLRRSRFPVHPLHFPIRQCSAP